MRHTEVVPEKLFMLIPYVDMGAILVNGLTDIMALLMSTQNICFCGEMKKNIFG